MRLYTYGDFRLGVLARNDHIADVTALVPASTSPGDRMSALIENWRTLEPEVRAAAESPATIQPDAVVLLAPQPRPRLIVAAPVNYRLHQQEMGGANGVYPGLTVRTIETYAGFVKASSSIVGPNGTIELPFDDRRVDHEAELGVVIGRTASQVDRREAMDYVFGYVPLLDITLRGDEDRSYRKSFDTFTPIGPAIVTADAVPDPGALAILLTVNGAVRQRANTCDLIFGVARLIELYSGAMTLHPGDIIATGTPDGVGPIVAGDEVMLSIDSVGELRMQVSSRNTGTGRVATPTMMALR